MPEIQIIKAVDSVIYVNIYFISLQQYSAIAIVYSINSIKRTFKRIVKRKKIPDSLPLKFNSLKQLIL